MKPRFVSDIHLSEKRPDLINAFKAFLNESKEVCTHLFILGDLFEIWIGDDDDNPFIQDIKKALFDFTSGGPETFLIHGNRDFLIGNDYAKRCGATILEDHHIISTGDENLLLLHGDTLCTDDAEYQQFRILVRDKSWQEEFLSKTVEERRNFAQEARNKSKSETSLKSDSIMDVNQEEVLKLFQKYHVSKILHGHTHRPAIHEQKVKSKNLSTQTTQRIVLGDWEERGWWAELYNNRMSLKSFPVTND